MKGKGKRVVATRGICDGRGDGLLEGTGEGQDCLRMRNACPHITCTEYYVRIPATSWSPTAAISGTATAFLSGKATETANRET